MKNHVKLHKYRSDTHPIPSPGGRVAPKGSGEECGRQLTMIGNVKTYSCVASCVQPAQRSDALYCISDCCPHSSSVRKSVPKSRFPDSFPPGEAIGAAPRSFSRTSPDCLTYTLFILLSFSLPADRPGVKCSMDTLDISSEKCRKRQEKNGIVSLETNLFLWYSIIYRSVHIPRL